MTKRAWAYYFWYRMERKNSTQRGMEPWSLEWQSRILTIVLQNHHTENERFQSYFNVKPTIITLNISHRNERCLGDVSLYTLYPILTLSRSTSLTSGLFCDRCLHNHVSRNASRTRSCFDLSLCLLNRTRRNHHSFYCKSIAATVHCNWHVSIDFLTSLAKAVLTCNSLKVGRSCPSPCTHSHYGTKAPASVGPVSNVDLCLQCTHEVRSWSVDVVIDLKPPSRKSKVSKWHLLSPNDPVARYSEVLFPLALVNVVQHGDLMLSIIYVSKTILLDHKILRVC